jgi:hypothetical protein
MVVVACCNLGAGPFTSSRINYVVELFTSQGFAYCPRADQWLAAIARAPDVVAVSFPLDKTAKGVDGALNVPMHLSEAGGHYSVEVAGGSGGPAGVFVLRVACASTVQILRGENAGRSVTYTNVARAIDKLGDWTGKTATFDVPGVARDGEGFIVLVQKGTPERPGAIIAAAKTEGL